MWSWCCFLICWGTAIWRIVYYFGSCVVFVCWAGAVGGTGIWIDIGAGAGAGVAVGGAGGADSCFCEVFWFVD